MQMPVPLRYYKKYFPEAGINGFKKLLRNGVDFPFNKETNGMAWFR